MKENKTVYTSEKDLRSLVVDYLREQVEIYGDELAIDKGVLISAGAEEQIQASWEDSRTLAELEEQIHGCEKCSLAATRQHFVFGSGDENAEIMLIGEAPGAVEDQVGRPFVGEAGQLLDRILAAINLKREQVYIGNILKCRPPNNRDPLPQEIALCVPFLMKQIELVNPSLILCLGRHAAQTLLQTTQSLSVLRGRVHHWQGRQVVVTYHPAALLRYPQFKRPTWADVLLLRRLYDEMKQGQNLSRR